MANPGSVRAIEDLEQLAELISSNAKTIKAFLKDSGIPPLSLNKDGPISFPATAPEPIQAARRDLLDASSKINQLVNGPADHLIWFAGAVCDLIPQTVVPYSPVSRSTMMPAVSVMLVITDWHRPCPWTRISLMLILPRRRRQMRMSLAGFFVTFQ